MKPLAAAIDILLVEDDPGDVLMIREALASSGLKSRVHATINGEAALGFLRQADPYRAAPRPALILLDLNLPGMDGREVLAEIKADPELRRIPVVVLTTSSADEDVVKAYDLHTNAYVTKPLDFTAFVGAVRTIHEFYLSVASIPLK